MLFTGLIAILISISGCGQAVKNNESKEAEKEWKFLNGQGYTIGYPEDWTLDQSGQNGTSFYLLSPKTSAEDPFRENINLIIQDLKGQNLGLDGYTKISEEQIKTVITNGKLLESMRIPMEESEFQKVIFTGDQGRNKLKFEQYYFIKNEKAYVLTLTCETAQFDSYQKTGEKIMKTFGLE